ncbi:hypothetical protein PIB30_073445 [Stylosanthes scabra]|uniref:PB1-like domain-containing protein n=1 Tax=Stylosanthes scabra TaxID=79078 RepID=A0ABU6WS77_9FABA|nr:hypothetical protein [Stylosanthes scabra]
MNGVWDEGQYYILTRFNIYAHKNDDVVVLEQHVKFLRRMNELVTFVYHHGGTLVTNENGDVVYELGETTEQPNQHVYTLDFSAVRNHHKVLGYDKIEECF